jgi:hypothetical protein
MNEQPQVIRQDDGVLFWWPATGLTIELLRVREYGHQTKAELIAKKNSGVLCQLSVDLLNLSHRLQLAKHLQKRVGSKNVNWENVLEVVCVRGLVELRRGEAIVSLEPDGQNSPSSFLLKPLLLENHPNVIYAPGGSGKSYLALFASLLLACGVSSNNLTCDVIPRRVLYLDWELSASDMKARVRMLMLGHPELTGHFPYYRKCIRSLADDVSELRKIVRGEGFEVLVVDSVAMAAGGDELEKSGPALRFYSAVRTLNLASLIIGHTPKQSEGGRTLYGSVFFENLARHVWEVKKYSKPGDRLTRIGLYHKKFNLCGHLDPIGFDLDINEVTGTATFTGVPLAEESDLTRGQSLADKIEFLLKRDSSTHWQAEDLASELGAKLETVYRTLRRYKNQRWTKQADGWTSIE